MRDRAWLTRMAAAALALMTTALAGCACAAEPEFSPEEVVTKFYRWYIGYPGNPLADREYRTSPYLADSFVQEVDEIVAGDFRADPILLAQDIPERFTVEEADISKNQTTVTIDFYWPGNPTPASRRITLEKTDGTWKITDIAMIDPE